jgi:hypothetical protein
MLRVWVGWRFDAELTGTVVFEFRREVKSTFFSTHSRGGTRMRALFQKRQTNPRASAQSAEKKFASYCPVPVSFITAGLNGALLLTVTAPLIDPFTLGVNVTLNVQVAPAATVASQGVLPDGGAE